MIEPAPDEDIDDLILPELAELVNAAAAEAGADITVDAEGLRKILAYAAGDRVHGDSPPPEPPPSPMAKSLLTSPFRHRTKAIVPVEIHRRGGGSYTAHYDNVAKKWVKKPQAATGGAPTKPPEQPRKIPEWSDLKGKYRNPGQWLEATFKTEEERDAARATASYRRIVEQWADDVGRQWGAGDPRERGGGDDLAPVQTGPESPLWVEIPLTVTGEAADARLLDVLDQGLAVGRTYGASQFPHEKVRSYAKSTHRAIRAMPRRARDLLADGLKIIAYSPDLPSMTERLFDEAERDVEAIARDPTRLAEAFATEVASYTSFKDPTFGKILREMASQPDLAGLIARDPKARRAAVGFMVQSLKLKAKASHGKVGGTYVPDRGVAHLNGPFDDSVYDWAKDAVQGRDEGRYRVSASDDSQTDAHAHELTHAIDRLGRFSRTPAWLEAWRKDLGGDMDLRAKLAAKEPVGRKPLTVYAASHPSEGFAEVGRLLYSGDCDLKEFEKRFPSVAAFFRANELWPEGVAPGKKTGLDEAFVARLPVLGETSHFDLLGSAWKDLKSVFREVFLGRGGR